MTEKGVGKPGLRTFIFRSLPNGRYCSSGKSIKYFGKS